MLLPHLTTSCVVLQTLFLHFSAARCSQGRERVHIVQHLVRVPQLPVHIRRYNVLPLPCALLQGVRAGAGESLLLEPACSMHLLVSCGAHDPPLFSVCCGTTVLSMW